MTKSNKIVKQALHSNLAVEIVRIKNATTTFGIFYQKGTLILNEDNDALYISLEVIKPYHTLTTLLASALVTEITVIGTVADGQIVVGTGTGVEGTTKLTYDDTDDAEVFSVTGRIETLGTGNSVFIGEGAGTNDDLSSNYNVFMGYQAGKESTTSHQNVAIGAFALTNKDTEHYSTAIGYKAACYAKGKANVAVGNYAGSGNSTNTGEYNTSVGTGANELIKGNNNTALGQAALGQLGTVNYNVGVGSLAGRYYGAGTYGVGAMTTNSNSIFIGYKSRASANGNTNEIGIGYEVIGNGSNTVTLGDDNVTDVYCGEDGLAVVHGGNIRSIGDKEQTPIDGLTTYTEVKAIDYVVHKQVTHSDANWYELFLDGVSIQMIIPSDTGWTFIITVVGIGVGSEYFSYSINGCITRDGSNNTTLRASNVTVIVELDANFDIRVAADDTNEALIVEVSDAGSSGEVINWGARVNIVSSYDNSP